MNIYQRLTCAFSFLAFCFSVFASYIAIVKTYAPDNGFVYPKLRFYQTTEKVLKDYTTNSLTLITPMIYDENEKEDKSKILKKELYVYLDNNKENEIIQHNKYVMPTNDNTIPLTIDDLIKEREAAKIRSENATVEMRKLTEEEQRTYNKIFNKK